MFVHHSALPVRSEATLLDAREAMRVVVHQVMEVLREQRRELAHVRELFALVCGRVHTWWCCARPCRRRSQRGEAEEAWALRRRRSTSDDGLELSGPLRHGQ
jgi:hypothetical protein